MSGLAAIVLVSALAGCAYDVGDATPPRTAPVATNAPAPTASATESLRASATSSPSAAPSPTPPPTPIPVGEIGELELAATSCPGGVVLEWSTLSDPRFHHYTVLRSPSREIQPDYPPIAPAVDWGTTFATDPFVTTAVDASILPGQTEWSYRAVAYDARDRPVAASPVRQATLGAVVELGALRTGFGPRGTTRLRWSGYEGDPACFSWYAVVASRTDPLPSRGDGSTTLAVISTQKTDDLVTDALASGATYFLRLQAVRATPLGEFVVAETEVATYTVP